MSKSPTQINRDKTRESALVNTLIKAKGIKRNLDDMYSVDYDDDYQQPDNNKNLHSLYSDDENGIYRTDSSDSSEDSLSSNSSGNNSSAEEDDEKKSNEEKEESSEKYTIPENYVDINTAKSYGLHPAHIIDFNRMDSSRTSSKSTPVDSNSKLMKDSPKAITKQEFAVLYVQHEAFHGVKRAQTDALFALLSLALPDVNWPTLLVKTKKNKVKVKTNLGDYAPRDMRSFELHVCINGCMSYINETSRFIKCKICHHPRFLKCNQHNCKNRLCNPWNGGHGLKYRISNKTGYYRPIIPLLKELFQWSFGLDEHIYCLDCSVKSRTAARYSARTESGFSNDYVENLDDVHTNRVEDIADSKQSCHHLNEMHAEFEKLRMMEGNEDLIEASFVLGEFYDGGTLFKRKNKSIWPLVLSILNCNPSVRVRPGIGMFLVFLHDLALGSVAEQSLFKDLFIPELNFLFDGTVFSFVDKNNKTVRVFLQARLVVHILDTIALLDVFKLKGILLNLTYCLGFMCTLRCQLQMSLSIM
jgi:hypothetical protein